MCDAMKIFLEKFERGIVVILIGMMAVVVLLATIELGWIILKDIITPPVVLLEINEILEIFGFFLLILIGVELLETIKAYLRTNVIHVEVVLEVALIAIARKVIILDLKEYSELTFLGIAALILALAIAYVLLKFRNTLLEKRTDTIPVQEKTAAEKSRNKNQ
jgi:uncharacterized membrane protein (DUF373 family)